MVMNNDENPTGVGPTGEYPKGRINADDQGELKVAMGINEEHKRIMIDFGTSVSWLGLGVEEAEAFANGLLDNVRRLREME